MFHQSNTSRSYDFTGCKKFHVLFFVDKLQSNFGEEILQFQNTETDLLLVSFETDDFVTALNIYKKVSDMFNFSNL